MRVVFFSLLSHENSFFLDAILLTNGYFVVELQISNFVIGLYFLSVVTKFGISKVYLGFASICLLAVMYIAGNVVETKGRSLEDIERELSPAL